jgi:hypothetical protein
MAHTIEFLSGAYKLVVYAKLVGEGAPKELMAIDLAVSESQALRLSEPNTGLYHDWGPDQQSYHSHIEKKPEPERSMEKLLEFLADGRVKPAQETLD